MDSLTQYELWQGIWHGLADGNFYELAHALERHNDLLRSFVPSTFVGNHDVTRIATSVGVDHVPHALAVLFTVAGVPTVYSGDELAYTATKEERLGGDDAVRPAFPEAPPSPAELDPRAASVLDVHHDLVAVRRRHPWLHRAHTDVVALGNRTIVLRTATGDSSVVVALNTSDAPVRLPSADAQRTVAGTGSLIDGQVELPAHGWSVMEGRPV